MDGARDFSLHCEFFREKSLYVFYTIILDYLYIALADSYNLDERDLDQRKLSVESSLILDLPTHLIVPSANIKLNETIGEGDSRSQCHHNDHYCIMIL